jgi:hypothetical protein
MGFFSEHGKYVEQRERDMSGMLSMAALEQHDPESPHRQPERYFLCPLPACSGNQNPRKHRNLHVKVADGLWKCHRCGEGGKLAEFWTDTPAGVTYTPSKRPAKLTLKPDQTIDECPLNEIRLDWLSKQPRLSADAAAPGREYLKLRGLDIEQCIAAEVIYTPNYLGKGRPGVIFLVYGDIHRKVLGGAQVRFIDNNLEHRVETLKDSKKKQSLFMTAGAIPDDRSFPWFLVVTEAPIDALSLSSAGIPAVATLGVESALPDWILNVLKFPAFVILASDNDEKGQDMAAEVQQQIQARMPAEHSLILPSGLWKSRSVMIRHPRTGKDWNEVLVKSGVNAVRHELESDPEYNLTDEVLRHLMS